MTAHPGVWKLSQWLAKGAIIVAGLTATVTGVVAGLLAIGGYIHLALGGLIVGPAILLRRNWSRRVAIVFSWLLMLSPPLLAYYMVGSASRMHRLGFAVYGTPFVFIATGLLTATGLWHLAAFTSRASHSWFRTDQADARRQTVSPVAEQPGDGLVSASGNMRQIEAGNRVDGGGTVRDTAPIGFGQPSWGLLVGALLVVVQFCGAAVWSYTNVVFEEIGRVGGGLAGLAIVEDRAYASVAGGLAVFDFSDPERIKLLGRSFEPWEPEAHWLWSTEVVAVGNRVFIGDGGEVTLTVYDVTDPHHPIRVAGLAATVLGGRSEHMAVNDDLLVVAGVADEPSTRADHPTTYADRRSQVALLSSHAPFTPTIYSRLRLDGEIVALDASDDHAYVVTRGDSSRCGDCDDSSAADTLHVVRIADGYSPVVVGRLSVPGGISDVLVRDQRAALLTEDGRIETVDVSYPRSPVHVGTISLLWPARSLAMAADGDTLWIRGTSGSVMRLDPGVPEAGSSWHFDTVPHIGTMAVADGRLLFVEDPSYAEASTIYALDPSTMQATGNTTRQEPAIAWQSVIPQDVHALNGSAYVLGSDGLVHRLAGPGLATLEVLGSESASDVTSVAPVSVQSLASTADAVYAVLDDGAFTRLDTESMRPTRSWRLEPRSEASYSRILAMADGVALLKAGVATVDVVDVADPDGFVRLGSITLDMEVNAAAVYGQHAYFAVAPSRLKRSSREPGQRTAGQIVVVDLSDPTKPIPVGAVKGLTPSLDDSYSLTVVDGRLFGRPHGLGVYSLEDPASPEPIARWFDDGASTPAVTPYGLAVSGPQIQVYRTHPPRTGTRVGASPNQRWIGPLAADGDLLYAADGQRGLRIIRVRRQLAALLD